MSRMLQMLTRARTTIATGGGQRLEPAVQARMERSFRHDFSAVRVHHGRTAADLGALAFTSGNHVHFAPGRYDPHGARGQELLGHELAHVVQQSSGRVQPTVQGKGMSINDDPALEREADEAGARAARGEPAGMPGGGTACSTVVQGVFTDGEVPIRDDDFLDDLAAGLSPLPQSAEFTAARGDGDDHDLLTWFGTHLGLAAQLAVANRLRLRTGLVTAGSRPTSRDARTSPPPFRPGDAEGTTADPTDGDAHDKGKDKLPYSDPPDDQGPSGSGPTPHHPRWRARTAHACTHALKKPGHGTLASELCNMISALSGAVIYPDGDDQKKAFLWTGITGGIVLTGGSAVRFMRAASMLMGRRAEDPAAATLELINSVLGMISGATSIGAGWAGIYAVDHDDDEPATVISAVMGILALIAWALGEALGAAPILHGLTAACGSAERSVRGIAPVIARLLGSTAKLFGILLMLWAALDASPAVFSVGFFFTLLGSLLTMVVGTGHALRSYVCGGAAERNDGDLELGEPPSTVHSDHDAERTHTERSRNDGDESSHRSDEEADLVEAEAEAEPEVPVEHADIVDTRSDGGEKVEAEAPVPAEHANSTAAPAAGGGEKVEAEASAPLTTEHADRTAAGSNGDGEKLDAEASAPLTAEHADRTAAGSDGGGEKLDAEAGPPFAAEHAEHEAMRSLAGRVAERAHVVAAAVASVPWSMVPAQGVAPPPGDPHAQT